MQALHPIEAPTATSPFPTHAVLNQSLDSGELNWLGERLRIACGPVDVSLPPRLSELVEQLARLEQRKA